MLNLIFRDEQQKSKEIDTEFVVKLFTMYFCSGDQNWSSTIIRQNEENFIVYQVQYPT